MVGFISTVWGWGNFLFRGFVLMMVWNWFANPILNAPTIGFVGALGLLMIMIFFKPFKFPTKAEKEEKLNMTTEEKMSRYSAVTFTNAFILLVGWIISIFL